MAHVWHLNQSRMCGSSCSGSGICYLSVVQDDFQRSLHLHLAHLSSTPLHVQAICCVGLHTQKVQVCTSVRRKTFDGMMICIACTSTMSCECDSSAPSSRIPPCFQTPWSASLFCMLVKLSRTDRGKFDCLSLAQLFPKCLLPVRHSEVDVPVHLLACRLPNVCHLTISEMSAR
jgi:hypothetical protein